MKLIRSLVGQDSTLAFATAADSLYSRYTRWPMLARWGDWA